MIKNNSTQTIFFKNKPKLIGTYSVVGPKEGQGFFKHYFDYISQDDLFGQDSYEKAERQMMEKAVYGALDKSGLTYKDMGVLIAGDLLNQIISASFSARAFDSSFLGVFGACSTMAESLILGAILVNYGCVENVVCATSSHFSTAERQFRFPLELGNQRPPTSQRTVTGAGACVVSCKGNAPYISSATIGKVTDYGICDVNNMGGAMACAAMSTLVSFFKDTKTQPDDYDIIVTGDLGKHGSDVLIDLLEEQSIKLGKNYSDCGHMYFTKNQKTFMGGSGCGCSATVLNSYLIQGLKNGRFKKVLFVPTGALLSTLSCQQGESIPSIAHAVCIEGV